MDFRNKFLCHQNKTSIGYDYAVCRFPLIASKIMATNQFPFGYAVRRFLLIASKMVVGFGVLTDDASGLLRVLGPCWCVVEFE